MKLLNPEDLAQTEIVYDKEINVAVAPTREAKIWKNKSVNISDFVKKLSVTMYTEETADEFRAMPKDQQDQIKNMAGSFDNIINNPVSGVIHRIMNNLSYSQFREQPNVLRG